MSDTARSPDRRPDEVMDVLADRQDEVLGTDVPDASSGKYADACRDAFPGELPDDLVDMRQDELRVAATYDEVMSAATYAANRATAIDGRRGDRRHDRHDGRRGEWVMGIYPF